MWHSHVNHYFKVIGDYPEMQMWLEDANGAPTNSELWGVQKQSYNFTDLATYMENQRKLRAKKGKERLRER